jgi:hypothetical protein
MRKRGSGSRVLLYNDLLTYTDACQECFVQWLNQQMESTTWEQITCPSSECDTPVTHEVVQEYAPKEVFTR